MKKICHKCKIEKDSSEYCKATKQKDGLFAVCNECRKAEQKIYYKNNKEIIDKKHEEYRKKNPDASKIYYSNNKDRDKQYKKDNLERYRTQRKERYHNDCCYRLKVNLRNRLRKGFLLYSKNGKTLSCKDYGIDFKEIYDKLGHKPKGYHLDHIIPLSVFDFDNKEHVRLAHLPCNLRYTTQEENLLKNDNIDKSLIKCSLGLIFIASEIGLDLKEHNGI